jgi:hypothetical protein
VGVVLNAAGLVSLSHGRVIEVAPSVEGPIEALERAGDAPGLGSYKCCMCGLPVKIIFDWQKLPLCWCGYAIYIRLPQF